MGAFIIRVPAVADLAAAFRPRCFSPSAFGAVSIPWKDVYSGSYIFGDILYLWGIYVP